MADYVDLHIHTDFSDGLQTPEEVIDQGLALGLKAVAITDHDALEGCRVAATYARDKDIEFITGIELSASQTDEDIHMLGYMIDIDHQRLNETVEKFQLIRQERGKKMVERLVSLGMKIDFDAIRELAGKASVGRPHVAEAMFNRGFVLSYEEAFRKYLYVGGPVYVPKAKLTPQEAINLIHEARGLAVMAHPALTGKDDLIPIMASAGMDGLEIYHPVHKRSQRKKYRKIAEKFGLTISGGSDSHNRKGRYGDIGEEKVPLEYLTAMKARREKLFAGPDNQGA